MSLLLKPFSHILPALLLLLLSAGCISTPPPPLKAIPDFFAEAEPLIAERRYGEAILILEAAAEAYPQAISPLVRLGQIYLRQHRWLLAEDAFNRALAHHPDHPLATAGLAEVALNQGHLDAALDLWQKAATLDPELPGVFTGLGRTHLARLEFRAAEEAFLKQHQRLPDPTAQWYLAALTAPVDISLARDFLHSPPLNQESTPERDYLLAALAPFSDASPPGAVAKATGIALVQLEAWPLALYALTIAAPEDAETLAFLGHTRSQLGLPGLEQLALARQLAPDSALPLYFEAIYFRRQGLLGSAEIMVRRAIARDPQNAAFYVELAQLKTAQGDFAAAEAAYGAAIKVAVDKPPFQLLLLRFYAERGYRLKEVGIPLAQAMLKGGDEQAELHALLGWMQFASGAPGGGEVALRRAIELEPDLVIAHYYLARYLETKGQLHLAREEYLRVIDLDEAGALRDLALKALRR